jgi:hypothetical protein
MAAGSRDRHGAEPPFEGGSQPVPESQPEMPGPGRSAMQTVVIVVAVLVVLAALVWLLVPLGGTGGTQTP